MVTVETVEYSGVNTLTFSLVLNRLRSYKLLVP